MTRQAVFRIAVTFLFTFAIARLGLASEEKAPLSPEVIEKMKSETELALRNLNPSRGGKHPTTTILPGECFVLWGDLFNDGHFWAITEAKHEAKVAYLEWKNGLWHFREAWDLAACWLPEGKKPEDLEYYHFRPPPQAFKLKNLKSDGSPVVLIPFDNDSWLLGYAIAAALPNHAGIKIIGNSSAGEPDAAAGYLITYDQSARKAWWGQRIYSKWINGAPVLFATWTDGNVDESDMGPTWLTVATSAASLVGEQHYRIPKDDANGVVVLRKDEPFATMDIQWKIDRAGIDATSAVELYLFEKLTGLPWKAYGNEINGTKVEKAKAIQESFDVRVTGTPEGIKLLSKPPAKGSPK